MRGERWEVAAGGAGGFLNPPGHPEHSWSVVAYRRREMTCLMSLSAAVAADYVSESVRAEAVRLLADWRTASEGKAPDPAWVRSVLAYFRGCYRNLKAGEKQWHASHLILDSKRDPMAQPEEHAGVNLIRGFYPGFMPQREDFNGTWGNA